MGPDILQTRIVEQSGFSVLAVVGEIDLAVRDDFDTAVDRAIAIAERGIVVDMSEVVYLDSTGCNCLVRGSHQAHGRGLDFVVSHPHGLARRVLELTGLFEEFCLPERDVV